MLVLFSVVMSDGMFDIGGVRMMLVRVCWCVFWMICLVRFGLW